MSPAYYLVWEMAKPPCSDSRIYSGQKPVQRLSPANDGDMSESREKVEGWTMCRQHYDG